MNDDHLPPLNDLLAASMKLERMGLADTDLIAARKHARQAIALTLGHPDRLAPALHAHADNLAERARERARAQYAIQNVRLTLTTGRLTHAARRLRDAIRATIARHDANRSGKANPH